MQCVRVHACTPLIYNGSKASILLLKLLNYDERIIARLSVTNSRDRARSIRCVSSPFRIEKRKGNRKLNSRFMTFEIASVVSSRFKTLVAHDTKYGHSKARSRYGIYRSQDHPWLSRGESGQGTRAVQLKVVLSKTKLRSCLDIPVSRIPPPSVSFQSCGIYAYGE